MARSPESRKPIGRRLKSLSMEDEIAHLRSLDLIGLQSRWQSVVGRPVQDHLPKLLLFGILAYRIQADALGDLDAATIQLLKRAATVQSLDEVLPLVTAPGSAQASCVARHCANPGMERPTLSGDRRRKRLRFRGQDLR